VDHEGGKGKYREKLTFLDAGSDFLAPLILLQVCNPFP
jgi:hypothetical protein